MSIASGAVRTTNFTINQACAELRTTASVNCRLLEISVVQATATAQSLGFGRPAAIGLTPGTTITMQRDNGADPAAVSTIATTWATAPTNPTTYMRRWNGTNVVGVGVVFSFPRGITVPVSSGFVVQNVTASIANDVNMVIDE